MRKALVGLALVPLFFALGCGGGAAPSGSTAAPTTAAKAPAGPTTGASTGKTTAPSTGSPAPAAASPGVAAPFPPGAKVSLRFAFAANLQTSYGRAALEMQKRMAERSNGRVQLEIFPDNQLGNQTETNQGAMQGSLDISLSGPASLTGFEGKFTALDPWYLFDSEEHFVRVLESPIGRELQMSLEPKGLIVPSFGIIGFRGMGNTKRPIRTPADVSGLKFRMQPSPLIFKSFELLGGVPIDYDYGQVYTGMKQGIIDGNDVVPSAYEAQKFYEVGKYYTWTKQQITAITWVISKQRYDTWPKEVQDLVLEEVRTGLARTTVLDKEDTAKSFDVMKQAGTEIITDIDLAAFREKVKPAWSVAEEKAGKEFFTRFLDTVEKLR